MFQDTSPSLKRSVRSHSGLFLAEGIVLAILGVIAIIVPFVAGLATTLFLGWLLVIAGVVGLIATLGTRAAPGFVWSLVSALVALIVGGLLIWNPVQGLFTLTALMTAYFIVDGISIISLAIAHRRDMSVRWQLMLANGVFDLLLAVIVIAGMPGTFLWALGLLLGIDLIFGGIALIALAIGARRETLL